MSHRNPELNVTVHFSLDLLYLFAILLQGADAILDLSSHCMTVDAHLAAIHGLAVWPDKAAAAGTMAKVTQDNGSWTHFRAL